MGGVAVCPCGFNGKNKNSRMHPDFGGRFFRESDKVFQIEYLSSDPFMPSLAVDGCWACA
jgi:hypothetical protein